MSEEQGPPSQIDLHQLKKHTKEVRVLRIEHETEISDETLFDYLDHGEEALALLPEPARKVLSVIRNPAKLLELFECLELDENKLGGWVCPVVDTLYLEFIPTTDRIMVSVPIIRWSARWIGDAQLKVPEKLTGWIARNVHL